MEYRVGSVERVLRDESERQDVGAARRLEEERERAFLEDPEARELARRAFDDPQAHEDLLRLAGWTGKEDRSKVDASSRIFRLIINDKELAGRAWDALEAPIGNSTTAHRGPGD
ncbi:MAG: hypothetical protein NT137_00165 [Methanomassiliicoccales archaeon]|nr:hypothetical protein [Methanomassiliicoccales archaeon]